MRSPHEFLVGQAFGFDLSIKGFLSLLRPLLFILFFKLSLRICPAIGLLPSRLLRLNLGLQESPSLGCHFERILGGQLLLILESAPFFRAEVGLQKCLFLESGALESCSLARLFSLGPGSPQNIILVGFLGIGLCLDAGSNDHLVGRTTGSKLGLDPRASQRVFSLKDGEMSKSEGIYL